VDDPHAMHIDATIMPLAPGKLLVNPDRYLPNPLFAGWEIIEAPRSTLPSDWPMYFCSPWVNVNVLSLDERTVVVESQEKPLIDVLGQHGFDCVPVDFRHVYSFGGSFHCVTTDVRRDADNGTYLS
jgi:glycine amidinotransferase